MMFGLTRSGKNTIKKAQGPDWLTSLEVWTG